MPERRPSRIRVLLCDDHAVVREGTRRLLEEEPDIEVVGEASDGLEAIEKARELSPDVVAMDISMPRMNGIEATRRIKSMNPSIQVLALTAYDDFAYVAGLLESGASGYILKSARGDQLVTAIRATASGDSVLDQNVAREVFSRLARRGAEEAAPAEPAGESERAKPAPGRKADWEALTAKETEVLKLAAKGLSNKQIASDMGVSPRTVQTHLASIFSKLGVSSRTEAVVMALKSGILSEGDLGGPSGGS
ncbi:MAG TPA: response regulator transcription factor [Firmicutes bacterium]|nr:response regulator transcription factor [Candidatus Fermentithermobacillaceae bacterium]